METKEKKKGFILSLSMMVFEIAKWIILFYLDLINMFLKPKHEKQIKE